MNTEKDSRSPSSDQRHPRSEISRFSPEILRKTDKNILDATMIATGLYRSIMASAPGAGDELKRLLNAYGRPVSPLDVRGAIEVLSQHTMALEMVEIAEVSSESAAHRLQSAMIDVAAQSNGNAKKKREYLKAVRSIFADLSAVAHRGDNYFMRTAELLFDRLGLTGLPKINIPHGTWLDFWEHSFLDNSRIARTYMYIMVENKRGWVTEQQWIYEPSFEGDLYVVFANTPFSVNPFKLAVVHMGNDQWLPRPSFGPRSGKLISRGKLKLPPESVPMSIIDPQLASTLRSKLAVHVGNPRYVEMIFTALDHFNFDLVMGPDIFPDTSIDGNHQNLAVAREKVLRESRQGDVLLTRQRGQELSRMIAGLDRGSWSHMLVVLDGGKVLDAQPGGLVPKDLDDFLTGTHRFAFCRVFAPLVPPANREKWAAETMRRAHQLRTGKSYSWRGALKAGLMSWLHLQVPPQSDATPNAIAYLGNLRPLVVW